MCDGVDFEGIKYTNFRYADDTAVIANIEEKLQWLNVVTEESEILGLKMSCEKIYVMVASVIRNQVVDYFIEEGNASTPSSEI